MNADHAGEREGFGGFAFVAKALALVSADLVLFGQQTSDGAGAVLWAAVAEHLRLPFVSQAAEITMQDGAVTVTRETEVGET